MQKTTKDKVSADSIMARRKSSTTWNNTVGAAAVLLSGD